LVASPVVARLVGVERRFGAVTALAGADLELRAGEVHGVLGANGAGKTTLLSVLGGMLAPDAGTVEVDGRPVRFRTPRDAWAHGIALVHQHFTLVPALTALENLSLGRRHGRSAGSPRVERSVGALGARLRAGAALDLERTRAEAEALFERTGLSVPLDVPVERLGVGDRQRTEIVKALLRDPRILVLDEPTAVLAPQEVDGLFALLRTLAREGRAVALVAHKLDEVLAVADRVTVLRAGRSTLSAPAGDVAPRALVRAMIGEDIPGESASDRPRRRASAGGAPVGRLVGVSVRGPEGEPVVDGVDIEVRRGEIVGIAGVEGNGQHQLALVLSGRRAPDAGEATLPDVIGYVPQDRRTQGVVAQFDLTENLALALQHDSRFRALGRLRWPELAAEAEELRVGYGVAAPDVATKAGALSGGNQQRVVVGRELSIGAGLLVVENPTRGLDVAAAAFVHAELRRLTERPDEGPGVALISTDLDEVLALSDRVLVMSRGTLREVPADRRTREGVGALMLGGRRV
jgi:simple sugar transport system ATP-binding protein